MGESNEQNSQTGQVSDVWTVDDMDSGEVIRRSTHKAALPSQQGFYFVF
jgi:hypothetical protein